MRIMVAFIRGEIGKTYDAGRIIVRQSQTIAETKKILQALSKDFNKIAIINYQGHSHTAAQELLKLEQQVLAVENQDIDSSADAKSLFVYEEIAPQENKSVIQVVEEMPAYLLCGDLGKKIKDAELQFFKADLLETFRQTSNYADYNREIRLKIGTNLATTWHADNPKENPEKTDFYTDMVTISRNMSSENGKTKTTMFAIGDQRYIAYGPEHNRKQRVEKPENCIYSDFNAIAVFNGLIRHATPYDEIYEDGIHMRDEAFCRPVYTIEAYARN